MKVFMFISGRSYGNSLKYKAFYACMSFMLMALFSTILTAKPAFADDGITGNITNGTMTCPKHGVFSYKPVDQGDGYWRCADEKQGASSNYTSFTCNTGYTKDEFSEERKISTIDNRTSTYKKGRCVKGSGSSSTSTVEKNAEALANKAGQDSLVTLISPKIETSPWYLGLSDADKVAAGCKYQSLPGAPSQASEKGWVCDDAAKQKLAKMLIGTCLAITVRTIAKRTNGDTGSDAMDAVFNSCLVRSSGVDEASIKAKKGKIAWDDIKKDVDTSGPAATEESKANEANEAKNSCGVDGMGWLICPLMNFAGNISDSAYSAISQFLSIDPKIFKNDSTSGGLKQAWNFFRDIANAVFAVIFLWVIFSQISNVGVSNYGIKKILPRLIIGALLVNLSFYLCQLAVDLSNILGFSLKGVLEGAASGIDTQSAANGSFSTIVVGALALTGAALFLFLAVSMPTIMALLLALLVVLVILIVRQAAIILLIAVSPLAFAAWLLPNTENLFKKWISMFKGLLVVFPVVSLLYGAGKLAGAILAASATDDPNNPKETMQFAALAVSILPLGATPFVLKSSLNSLGSFAGKLGGLSNMANKRLGGAVMGKSRIGDIKKGWQKSSAKRQANRRSGNTWLGRKADALRGSNSRLAKGAGIMLNPRRALDNSWAGRVAGLSEGAAHSQAVSDELFENEVKGQALALRGMTSSEIATIASTGKTSAGKKVSRSMYAAAIDQTMSNGGFSDRVNVLSSLAGKDAVIKNRAIKAAFAKGDNNILGNEFGDAILEDKIKNMDDLESMAIKNAADGNLQAEHLVQNAGATKWLAQASIDAYGKGNPKASAARHGIKDAAIKARLNPNTSKNINGTIDTAFKKVGA